MCYKGHKMAANSQLPDALLCFLLLLRVSFTGPQHLRPAHRLLQLHEALLVLVPLHQHSRHLHSREPLPLRHRNIVLRRRKT